MTFIFYRHFSHLELDVFPALQLNLSLHTDLCWLRPGVARQRGCGTSSRPPWPKRGRRRPPCGTAALRRFAAPPLRPSPGTNLHHRCWASITLNRPLHHPKRETSKIEIGCLSWVYLFYKNLTAMNNTSWKFQFHSRGSRTRKFPSMYPIAVRFQTKREWVKNKQLDYWPMSSTSQTLRSKWTQRRLSTLTYWPVLGLQCCYTLVIHFGSNCHNSLHCNWTHNPKAHLQSIEFAKSIIVPRKKTDSMMLVFFAMTKSTFEKHWEAFHHPTQTQRNLSCWCLKRFEKVLKNFEDRSWIRYEAMTTTMTGNWPMHMRKNMYVMYNIYIYIYTKK